MKPTATKNITRFKGLNNVSDPLDLPLGWMTQADNIDITDTYAIKRRDGYERKTSGQDLKGAYSTLDFKRLYVADAGQLKRVLPSLSMNVIAAGLGSGDFYAAEVNQEVYYSTGSARGIIMPDDSVRGWDWTMPTAVTLRPASGRMPAGQYRVACTFAFPDGRETGSGDATTIDLPADSALVIEDIPQMAGMDTLVYISPADSTGFFLAFAATGPVASFNAGPEALGMELTTALKNPPPRGTTQPLFFMGRMHLMAYYPQANMTTIWASEPLAFHLFDYTKNFLSIPGRGRMLASTEGAVIIGTDDHIYAFDGEELKELADYGVVPGHQWAHDKGEKDDDSTKLFFWTTRGLCCALPFANLTLRQISVDSGASAGAAIVQKNGAKKFVVALQKGGQAFNKRT